MTAKPRSLKNLQHHQTRYEVAIALNTGEIIIADFMINKSKKALIVVAKDHANIILPLMPEDDKSEWTYSMKDGLRFSNFARVYFTGRTERDAAVSKGVV